MKPYLIVCLIYGGAAASAYASEDQDNPEHKITPPTQTTGPTTTADSEVFFAFDSAKLSENGQTALLNVAEHAKDAPGTMLVLAAHADARGTAPYNVGLSVRRAEAVRDFLTENGYSDNRIVMTMYGEDGPRRDSLAEDRRVSVTLTAEPLHSIIDRAGPDATAVVWNDPVTIAEIDGPEDENVPQTAWR